ncbi:MAG: DMT family transporter [Gammaproteobacteria bacterium]
MPASYSKTRLGFRKINHKYFFLAIATGIILGTAVTVSRFAYLADASGIMVTLFRGIFMVIVLGVGLRVSGYRWPLPKRLIPLAMINGVLMAIMTYGNIGAVEFIPIGLAALLFFTFPVMIALLVMIFRLEQVKPVKLAAVILAFIGLAIVLGVSVGTVDWRGPALSLSAAIACAINAVLFARYFRDINVFVTTFHFSVYALLTLGLIALVMTHSSIGETRLPLTLSGWLGALGVGVLQGIGTPMYLYAILKIGALKTGMVTNIQPLTSIAQAWAIFGEVLTIFQAFGGCLVLAAIAIMQWADLRAYRHAQRDD